MEVLNTKILRGPNYWSNYRKNLIVMKIDLQQYEELPSNQIEGFSENLKKLIPSLYNHRCSVGELGGFFQRLDQGTWFGHIIEHIALELQWLAGMESGYGRTRSADKPGVYHVVFSYIIEDAGLYAGQAAFEIVKALATQKPYTNLEQDIEHLKDIYEQEKLGPSTESIVKEAERRGIPYTRLDHCSLIMLGQGRNQKIISSTLSSHTSGIAVDIAADKEMTKDILERGLIPIPKGVVIHSIEELDEAIESVRFPLVIKPQGGNHGKGITSNVASVEKAILGFKLAKKYAQKIIIEKFIRGFDYRFLVIDFKLIAVAKRTPASVIGNGISTIQELIDKANQHPMRGEGHENFLTKIKIDEITLSILFENGYTLETVLPKGKIIYLKDAANISSGGTAIDVTNFVHPDNVFLAERVARLIGLDICGIDIIADDITVPITEKNGAVIEVNAGPGFRMHLSPTKGIKRNVAKPVVDMLYPEGQPARIPLVAVTGTNGKTTIVRLIAHLAKQAGFTTGYTTTEGIYINNKQIFKGDCSGPASANVILRDPLVDFAVLECARGGIIRSGLGFDKCNISILSNISEDHLGIDDIHTLEELARVKSVLSRSTFDDGYAILNADDDLVYAIKNEINCHVALFSIQADNKRIEQHCQQGGLAAYVLDKSFVIQEGKKKTTVAKLADIPVTFSGFASAMIKNILPAALAGVINGFSIPDIAQWLATFNPTPETLPGRMNLFTFDNFKVLIDYAHNEDAFIELRNFISQVDSAKKVGIIAATGDRRNVDIRKVGYYAAQTFDEIIIRQDRDSRGRTHQELTELVKEGVRQCNPNKAVRVIPNEFDAIQYAMDNALPDTFIMYFPDEILKAVDYVKRALQQSNYTNQYLKGQTSA